MVIAGDANSISAAKSQETLLFAQMQFDRGDEQAYCNHRLCISMVSIVEMCKQRCGSNHICNSHHGQQVIQVQLNQKQHHYWLRNQDSDH